ncbi:MAG: SEC-C domain-containing protein [Acidobacteria bacterium]|nr:SEC-C domain-containing protein [Acidobacteriota bacterium]
MSTLPIGRNDPCPCGSGKKYKKCCLEREAVGRDAAAAERPPKSVVRLGLTMIDELSNKALDEIHAKRYDEAEKLCKQLISEYPDMIDGQDRMAMLREAQGRFEEAANHYGDALSIMTRNSTSFGPEAVDYCREQYKRLLAKRQA